jgi:hypothetical protein
MGEREGTPEDFAAMFGKTEAKDESVEEPSVGLPRRESDLDFIRSLHPTAEEIDRRRRQQDAEQQQMNVAKLGRKQAQEEAFVRSLMHPNYVDEDQGR